jgi:hypothetical protein
METSLLPQLRRETESQKHSLSVDQKPLNAGIMLSQSSKKEPRLQLSAQQTKYGEALRQPLLSEMK